MTQDPTYDESGELRRLVGVVRNSLQQLQKGCAELDRMDREYSHSPHNYPTIMRRLTPDDQFLPSDDWG